MNAQTTQSTFRTRALRALFAAALAAASASFPLAGSAADAAKPAGQKAFPTADAAFQALADAAKAGDTKTIVALLGPGGSSVVNSGDRVMDRKRADGFAASYATKHAVKMEGDAKATLTVGSDDFPLPIPAVKGPNGWRLDAAGAERELLARRIGDNELYAIQVVRAIVDAQFDYSSEDRDRDGLRDYTTKFISTKGRRDGLYWPTKDGEAPSPLGPLVGRAAAEGYKGGGGPTAYHGYHYRIVTAQGPDAQGGVRNYMARGKLLGGFAVVAYPATYGNSGIMTFMANQDGTVYQKDLGSGTGAAARGLKAFNPDKSWTAVK